MERNPIRHFRKALLSCILCLLLELCRLFENGYLVIFLCSPFPMSLYKMGVQLLNSFFQIHLIQSFLLLSDSLYNSNFGRLHYFRFPEFFCLLGSLLLHQIATLIFYMLCKLSVLHIALSSDRIVSNLHHLTCLSIYIFLNIFQHNIQLFLSLPNKLQQLL